MKLFRFTMGLLLLVLPFVLPFWLTFGRILLGSGGWATFAYLIFYAPILFVALLTFVLLVWTRRDVKNGEGIGTVDAFLVLALFLSVLLHGFFLIDGGDTPESINSLAMNVFGPGFKEATEVLTFVTFLSTGALLLVSGVVFIYERVKQQPLSFARKRF